MSDGPDEKEPGLDGLSDVKFPEPPSDADIQARLEEAKSSLERSKAKYDEVRQEPKPASSHSTAVAMSIAYAVLILPTVGGAVGWCIDRRVGGSLFATLGLLAGGIAALLYSMRAVKRK